MGYLVETSGRILLPESLERQALTVLEVRMGAQQGWFDADADHVDSLEELAPYAAAQVRREGDWLLVDTRGQGDPQWSEQASEFYRSLGSFVREGEVQVRGEDGQVWSYLYSADGVQQRGDNGFDGTPGQVPAAETAAAPPAPPAPPTTAPEPPAPTVPPTAATPPGTGQGTVQPGVDPSQFQYPGREDRPTPPPAPEPPTSPYGQVPGPHEGAPDSPYAQQDPLQPPAPPTAAERAWADPPPASGGRTALMAAVLVVGVILIIGIALLVSGL